MSRANSHLDTLHISAVAGGVSGQPPHRRFEDQVESAINMMFDVRDGAGRRPGSNFGFVITGLPADFDGRLHAINRSTNEKYFVLYGWDGTDNVLRVFDLDGNEASITKDAAAVTYLEQNSANAGELRLVTVADSTIVLNTTVPTGTLPTPNYTVTSQYDNYDLMIASTPANDTYHRVLQSTTSGEQGYYKYDPEGGTYAKMVGQEVSGGWWGTEIGGWDQKGYANCTIRFLRQNLAITNATFTNATKILSKAGAFADYEWQQNDLIRITDGTGVTTGFTKIAAKIDDDAIELEDDIGGTNPADVDATRIATDLHWTWTVTEEEDGRPLADMHAVAAKMQDQMQTGNADDPGLPDVLVEWTGTGHWSGYFTITSPWAGSESSIYEVRPFDGNWANPTGLPNAYGKADLSAADSPFSFANAQSVVDGTGTGVIVQDPAERWVLQSAPGTPDNEIDQDKMPVELVRTSVSPLEFELNQIDWNARTSGDNETNPTPRLILDEKKIADITIKDDRLVLAGSQFVVTSQSGDLFNFYLDDITNPTDADPIDLIVTSEEIADLDFIVPFNRALIALSKGGQQFDLTATESFAPNKVSVQPSTRYETQSVRPIQLGSYLYFASNRERGSVLYEYQWNESIVASFADDITAHIPPDYIPANIRTMVADSRNNTIVVVTENERRLYIYRAFWAQGSKQQSAWSTWLFNETYNILDAVLLDGNCYFLTDTGAEYSIEHLPLSHIAADTDWPYAVHLDRSMTLTGSFDGTKTTFDLDPLVAETSTINRIVLGPDFGSNAGDVIEEADITIDASPATTISVLGDYSAGPVVAGRFYSANITLSRPYRRDGSGRAMTSEKLYLNRVVVEHIDSGNYKITATQPGHVTQSRSFVPSNNELVDEHGYLEATLSGDLDELEITISSRQSKPMIIAGIEYAVEVAERMR